MLFALNRRHLLNVKTALPVISALLLCPEDFRGRLEALLLGVGASPARIGHSISQMHDLLKEAARLSGELYYPKYDLSNGSA